MEAYIDYKFNLTNDQLDESQLPKSSACKQGRARNYLAALAKDDLFVRSVAVLFIWVTRHRSD